MHHLLHSFAVIYGIHAMSLVVVNADAEKDLEGYPDCTNGELVTIAETLQQNERKKECQANLKTPEMFSISDPLALCRITSCVGTLKTMIEALPHCKYQAWAPQYHAKKLLLNCGIEADKAAEKSEEVGSMAMSSDPAHKTLGSEVAEDQAAAPVAKSTPSVTSSVGDWRLTGKLYIALIIVVTFILRF